MNTIYDGTYVIGQTSATNFQAGPGIAITQPSEGTVRIANDETVLFSGERYLSATGAFALSENPYNFEEIQIWGKAHDTHKTTLGTVLRPNEDNKTYVDV